MKSLTKSTKAVEIILEFVELQNNLITAFRQKFPHLTDWEYLLNCPKSGFVLANGEEWQFQRHGVGICFSNQSSKVVDVHVGIWDYPRSFEAWQLSQYFESMRIEKISYLSDVFDVSDEDSIENLLNDLLADGLIAIASANPKLYLLKS